MSYRKKLKQILVFVIVLTGVILNGNAQTNLKFTYNCSLLVLNKPRVLVSLRDSNNKVELLIEFSNDTILGIESSLNIPLKENYYILSVQFENKVIGQEILDYPFTLKGNEMDIEININFRARSYDDEKERERGAIEVIKYYEANPNIEIKYLPELKEYKIFKGPFFLLENNSDNTIYGINYNNFFRGTLSVLKGSVWNRMGGILVYDIKTGIPLLPGLAKIALVSSFGTVNKLPKGYYKYILLYKIDKNMHQGLPLYLEKDNFIWSAGTKEYYRLIYEFDVK